MRHQPKTLWHCLNALIVLICVLSPVIAEQTEAQRELEQRFDEALDANDLRKWMKRLSAKPHHVGSPHGLENAQYLQRLFRSWGFETRIDRYDVLFPTPTTRHLQLLEPTTFEATLSEPSGGKHGLPPYNAFSIDGDVSGTLVYVNYGIPEDYETLAELGIDVEGKIVLARYGRSWRGIKPKLAAMHGAIGCILYSDPADDGYRQGDVYPKGPFKSGAAVQRGSVLDMPLYPGDPLTPGRAAVSGAQRLPRDQAPTLTRIPVLPISYDDALPLLQALEGSVAPADWRGALPLTYHVGPGPAKVRLQVAFNWRLVTARNVIAQLEGREQPNRWIMRGNHHDAWVYGADDPVSGLVAMLAEAQAVGKLAREGWRPRRTIVYAAWDAEEPGLLGSTEWVEDHAAELLTHGVVYINSDSNGRGFLYAGGSHTLEQFMEEIAEDVLDPQTGATVGERRQARQRLNDPGDEQEGRFRLAALGSGSDYTPFLQHLGIASLNLGFGGENAGGEYHTVHDNFEHYMRFGDPEFRYGITLARVAGRATLRLAEAPVLPFAFDRWTDTVDGYVNEIDELVTEMRDETERHNLLLAEGVHRLAADPTRPFVMPTALAEVPHINLAPLRNAMTAVRRSVEAYQLAVDDLLGLGNPLPAELRDAWNKLLFRSERLLTVESGLPGRSWYRHQIYAPGFFTGYGVKTLPALRETLEQRRWDEVPQHVTSLAETLGEFQAGIDELQALIAAAAASGHDRLDELAPESYE